MHFRTRDPFQRRMDLGGQTTDPIRDAGDFADEVVVIADRHLQLGQGVVTGVGPAQRVWQRPGGVGVTGVGLRRARVQVSEPAHNQAGQVGDLMPAGPGYRDGQRNPRLATIKR